MTPETFVDIFRDTLQLVVILVSAIILPSLVVGLVVSIFQAATSINEQTLSFLPRLLVTLFTLIAIAHWLTEKIMEFMIHMANIIPSVVG